MDMDISMDIHAKSVDMDGYGWEISYPRQPCLIILMLAQWRIDDVPRTRTE